MMNVKAISLKGRIPSLEGIEFLCAEWWDDSGDLPRFVVIRYTEASGGEKSLRMDLDKRIFLDHLTDPEKDRAVQDQVLRVWGIVAEDLREGNLELVVPGLERSYTTAILTGTPHSSARYRDRALQDGQAIDSFRERGSAMAGATTLSRSLPKSLPKLTPHAITDAQLRVPSVRKTPDNATVLANLGLLADLAGTWKGTGFNLVARPDKEGNANLYLELNQTQETLEFTPIASAIPNRGFGMDDIELFGLTYLQQISDSVTGGALHIEPGIWVRQPATIAPPEQPPSGDDIAFRMGSIPHGNAILAKGTAQKFTGPPTLPTSSAAYNGSIFPSFNSTPFPVGGPIFAPGTAEFNLPPPPPPAPAHGFTQYTITNPPSAANPRTPFGNVPAVPLLDPGRGERSDHAPPGSCRAAAGRRIYVRRGGAQYHLADADRVRHDAEPGDAHGHGRRARRRGRHREHSVPSNQRGFGAGLCDVLDNDRQPSEAEREFPPAAIRSDGALEFPGLAGGAS
ncbi:MAG: hypothetical protein ABSF12_26985 [Bryobacteraceae bacterium]